MGFPEELAFRIDIHYETGGLNYWTSILLETLFYGKMRGLFALLFGVSSVLIIEKAMRERQGINPAKIYFRRLFWLAVIGLLHAYLLLWWGEVLFKYALLGALLFAFRRAHFSILLAGMFICLMVLILQPTLRYLEMADLKQGYEASQSETRTMSTSDEELEDKWLDLLDETEPDEESILEETSIKQGGYFGIFEFNAERVFEEFTVIFLQDDIWDMMLYMLLGIYLYRIGFFGNSVSPATMRLIALSGMAIGLAIHGWINFNLSQPGLDPASAEFYLIFFDLGRLPFALGYLALFICIFGSNESGRIGKWLAAAGRMALSNYLLQSVIGAFVFYGFGLALFNQVDLVTIVVIILAASFIQIVFSVFWLKRFRHGPMEWVWRSLTYWTPQPLVAKA
ncbi:MAG: DUF418 domain-containing protein [Rhizobiaceae bacterium]